MAGNHERSDFESEFFGLNVFRNAETGLPDAKQLREFAISNNADLIRLKIDVKHEGEMNHALQTSGLPYYYSHSIFNVIAEYSSRDIPPYKNNDLSFEQYNGSAEHRKRFFNLVYEGMFDDPIGYHKTPFISHIIPKEKEAECYASYYATYYNGSNPGKIGFIMKKGADDAGVFVFELEEGTIYTSMAAVLQPFRSNGIFHDMKIFRQRYCAERDIRKAVAGSRSQNFNTPNTLLKMDYKIFEADHVFHLPVLLNYSLTKPISLTGDVSGSPITGALGGLANIEIVRMLEKKQAVTNVRRIVLNPEVPIHHSQIRLPVANQTESLALVQHFSKSGTLAEILYEHRIYE